MVTGHAPLAAPSDEFPERARHPLRTDGHGEHRTRHNLPAQLTSFIGRAAELEELSGRIGETRLLTLTGVGGIGKTRLQLELANQVLDRFRDGVRLVELAPVADASWVPYAVAGGIDVREVPGRPIEQTLIDSLRAQEMLLVLDSCEHVVDGCASLCETLLQACPDLRVLATSRESLHVRGEVTHQVPPLVVPKAGRSAVPAALAGVDAVQLFIERAKQASEDFALTDENAGDVAEICRRLDGIPLAIELAAARCGVLAPGQILSLLEDRFRLLTEGSHATPRQRTLEAAIGWSYDLLTDREKDAFRRLSVFAGGFRLDAAGSVCAGSFDEYDLVAAVGHLVDKSLLTTVRVGGDKRYRQLDTIRSYGLKRLAAAGEAEDTRRLHAEHFLAFAESRHNSIWVDRYLEDADNFRAALEWGRSAPPDFNLRLVAALGGNWATNGYNGEAAEWMRAALERGGGDDESRGLALYYAGVLAWYAADLDHALRCADKCIEAGQRLPLPNVVLGHGLQLRAMTIGSKTDFAGAVGESGRALEIARQVDDSTLLVDVLAFMSGMEVFLGQYEQAAAHAAEGAQRARQYGFHFGEAICLWVLGLRSLLTDDAGGARKSLQDGLQVAQSVSAAWVIANLFDSFALLALFTGQGESAFRLFGAANAAHHWAGWVRIPPFQAMYMDLLKQPREELGADLCEGLVREGEQMELEAAIAYALRT